MNLKRFIPILDWLPNYQKKDLPGDLIAGLTVGVMLIPQGMAYALIAGLPPIYGLYASTVPILLYAILGTSRQLAVGPVAMVSLLTAAGIGTLTQEPSLYITLTIVLTLMVGAIQFTLGVFRLGFLVNFLSHPVISGFTSAAALIIGLGQLKHLMGVSIDRTHHIHEILLQAIEKIDQINLPTLGIGLIGIVLIMGAKRIHKAIPGPLLAVLMGILLVAGTGLHESGVKIVGSVPEGLPAFQIPGLSAENWRPLLPIALTIALVSFMESIAIAKAIEAKHKDYKVDANQELIGLGAANIGGSFFQSFPTTGGFSRTAVNDQAGARTGLAAIISASLIMLTLLFLTPLFYYLPKAVLASLIMVAAFGLINLKEARHLWKADRRDFWLLIITFVATLSLGIEQGIGVGVVLSLALVIYQSTRPHIAELGRVPDTRHYRNIMRFDQLEERPDLLILRFDSNLYFANTQFFKNTIEEKIRKKGKDLKAIILNAESIHSLDSSAVHALEEVIDQQKEQGLDFYFTGVIGPVRDILYKTGLVSHIGADHFFMDVPHAVSYFDQQMADQSLKTYTLQSNRQ